MIAPMLTVRCPINAICGPSSGFVSLGLTLRTLPGRIERDECFNFDEALCHVCRSFGSDFLGCNNRRFGARHDGAGARARGESDAHGPGVRRADAYNARTVHLAS